MLYSKHSLFRFWGMLLIAVLLLPALRFSCNALNIPQPTSRFYVNDFANLLDAEIEDYIVETNIKLYKETGAQVVIVTLPSLNGENIEEFSTALFRQYGIGSQEKNNGVLLLLALEDRTFRIEVGYGLEGALNDAKTGRIQDDYIIPYFKDSNWNDGIRNGFDAILQEIKTEYGSDIATTAPQTPPEPSWIEDPNNFTMIMMGIAAVVGAIIGKLFKNGLIPNLLCLVFYGIVLQNYCGTVYTVMGVFGCALFALIGWAITSPDDGSPSSSYSGSSYSSRSYHSSSSRSSSSYHSSGSSHSGGGGRSGGGGSTRKF